MKLTKLFTGVAAAALLSGAASAYDLVYTDVDGAGNDIDSPQPFAEEIDVTGNLANGILEFIIDQSANNVFTTDDVLITISLANAEFDADLTVGAGNALDFTNCATAPVVSISSGGDEGDSEVVLLVSGFDGCDNSTTATSLDNDEPAFRIPFVATGGDIDASVNVVTDSGGTPVDGGTPASKFDDAANAAFLGPILDSVDAFDLSIAAAETLVATLQSDPIYTRFLVGAAVAVADDMGDVDLVCDTTALVDLADSTATADCTNDVDGFAADAAGDFAPFDNGTGATGAVTIGGAAGTLNADLDEATFDISGAIGAATGVNNLDLTLGVNTTPDPDPTIQEGAYDVEFALNLAAGLNDETLDVTIGQIVREGTSVELPWVPSGALAAANGSSNVIRFANTSDVDARVFAEVEAASDASFVNPGLVQLPDLPAGGEAVYTSDSLTAEIGDEWGRGDVNFVFELLSGDLSARRFVTDSNGSLTELGGAERNDGQNF